MVLLFGSLLFCLLFFYVGGNALLGLLRMPSPRNPIITCWLGFFALSLVLIPLSFLGPLNRTVFIGVLLATFPGWHKTWQDAHIRFRLRGFVMVLLCSLIVALMTAYTVWPVHQYDTDLYHAQMVRWLNTYGMPWGLGNLHSRLANNSAWIDVAAFFDNFSWDGRSAWLMTGLLLCLVLLYFLYEILYSTYDWAKLYAVCMLPAIFFIPETTRPNLYYDTASLLLHCIIVLESLYIMIDPRSRTIKNACILLCLSALAFMIKPLVSVSVIAASFLALWTLIKIHAFSLGTLLRVFTPPAIAAALWVGKNIVLSGYPFYPVPVLPLPVDWVMLKSDVLWNYNAVRDYARMGNLMVNAAQYAPLEWVPSWLTHQLSKNSFRTMMLFPCLGGGVIWAAVLCKRLYPFLIAVLVWQLGSLVYWFFMAPDPRFGFGFAWSFLASGVAMALWAYPRPLPKLAHCACVFLAVLLVIRLGMDLRKAPHALLAPQTIPPRPVTSHLMEGRGHPFFVYVPVDGAKCGDAFLPCAPNPSKNLCLRVPGELGQGFRQCTP